MGSHSTKTYNLKYSNKKTILLHPSAVSVQCSWSIIAELESTPRALENSPNRFIVLIIRIGLYRNSGHNNS